MTKYLKKPKRGRIYFGSRFNRYQPMISRLDWAEESCSPHGKPEEARREASNLDKT